MTGGHADAAGSLSRIAVGVDSYPEGRDAIALGESIALATGAELMLVAVHTDPLIVLPDGMDWAGLRRQPERVVREARDGLAPGARVVVETDMSVARALRRVVRHEHRDLLVVGSSRHGAEGQVRISPRTRQLLCDFECAIAVAPRGIDRGGGRRLERIGVGYDGGPESRAALALAATIARGAGAELVVRGAVDDESTETALREQLTDAAVATGAEVKPEVVRGRPADALLELCGDVDLMVIGSRHWGPLARLTLGSTGEALFHDASCPVIVVPRPREDRAGGWLVA